MIGKREFDGLCRQSTAFRRGIHQLSEARRASAAQGARPDVAEPIWLVNRSPFEGAALAALLARTIERTFGDRVAVVTPSGAADAAKISGEWRSIDADYLLCVTRPEDERALAGPLSELVSTVVCFTHPEHRAPPFAVVGPQAVHRVELGRSATPHRQTSDRRSLHVPLGAGAGDLTTLRFGPETLAALERLARLLTRRVVGLALGGGGAWGFGHVALLRALHRARIPVDLVAGVSFGSVVGAFYASEGLAGLDRLIAARRELSLSTAVATVTSSAIPWFIRRHLRHRLIEELPLPFRPVAVDIQRGVEKAFRSGSLAEGVRASGSFPGVFGPTVYRGVRYVDGCVKNNVPASSLVDDGADFIIASNVVPPPRIEAPRPGRMRALTSRLSPLHRLRDTIRSMYLVVNDVGHRQSSCANVTFAPELSQFLPTEFGKAPTIVEATDAALGAWLGEAGERFSQFCRGS